MMKKNVFTLIVLFALSVTSMQARTRYGNHEYKKMRKMSHMVQYPGTPQGKMDERKYWADKKQLLRRTNKLRQVADICEGLSPDECEEALEELRELQENIKELEAEEEAEMYSDAEGIAEALEELDELKEDFDEIESDLMR